jgi:hypothetical protein
LQEEDARASGTREPQETQQKRQAELQEIAQRMTATQTQQGSLERELYTLRDDSQRRLTEKINILQDQLNREGAEKRNLEAQRQAELQARQEAQRRAELQAQQETRRRAELQTQQEAQRQAELQAQQQAESAWWEYLAFGLAILTIITCDFLYIKDKVNPFGLGIWDTVASCLWVSSIVTSLLWRHGGFSDPYFLISLGVAVLGTVYAIITSYKYPYMQTNTRFVDFLRTFVLKTVFASAISISIVVVALVMIASQLWELAGKSSSVKNSTSTTWEARIRLPNAGTHVVAVEAKDPFYARQLLEAQYGAGSIVNGPVRRGTNTV